MAGTPRDISIQLRDLLNNVEQADNIPNRVKRDMVVFIDRVVEVVEQAYREVFRLAVEIKFIPDEDLTSKGVAGYQQEAERLRERDRYRDVEFICGRLHVLRRQFHEEGFDQLTQGFDHSFHRLLDLIDDREGELIRIADDFMHFVFDGLQRLRDSVGDTALAKRHRDELADQIEQRLPDLRSSLEDLHAIHLRILPTVGGEGLVEILSRDPAASSVTLDVSRHVHIGGDVVGRDKITPGGDYLHAGHDIAIAAANECRSPEDARSALLAAANDFPPDRRQLVQKQVDEVFDAISRKAPPTEIEQKAKALDMFLESGKELLSAPAKAGWQFIRRLVLNN